MGDKIKAMVMSAGIGSRLEPLTLTVPKPLVPIANKPVMSILLESLVSAGISDVICNTYYLADQIIEKYINNQLGINFNYIKEENLSGTAGGVKKCQFFFDGCKTFVVLSADGLTNADIKKGIELHKKSSAIATIGIKAVDKAEVSNFGVVVTDSDGYITEFQEKPSVSDAKSNFINTGIYVFDYKIFDYIPENKFFDFAKDVFPSLLKEHAINTFEVSEYWSDIGTIEQYKQSVIDLFEGKCKFNHSPFVKTQEGAYICGKSRIPHSARFLGISTIGDNVSVGENTVIENSIIWDNVTIGNNLHVRNSVIASGCSIQDNIDSNVIGANMYIEKIKI